MIIIKDGREHRTGYYVVEEGRNPRSLQCRAMDAVVATPLGQNDRRVGYADGMTPAGYAVVSTVFVDHGVSQ